LVTGAARGIGKAFASHLAAEGFDLLLVDREADETESVAEDLRSEHGRAVDAIVCDLTEPGLAQRASQWTDAYEIGVLVNNAGTSDLERFFDISLDTHLKTLDLNCRATLILSHVVGRAMAARQRGAIVMVSSASAFSGSPYFCHYAATKGYGLNLGCGLWSELRGSGVDVLTLCPGMTNTQPVRDRGLDEGLPFYVPISEPGSVALSALAGLGRQPVVVPAWGDKLSAGLISKLAPRAWALSIIKRSLERMKR